jgi:hypothetical protein
MKTHGTLREDKVARARKLWRDAPTAASFWDTRISLAITVQEAIEGRRLAIADAALAAIARCSHVMDLAPEDLI